MLTYLGQTVLHAIVAAAVVETLLRAWRIEEPESRLTLRLLALVLPLIALPAFQIAAPYRSTSWFADRWAILAISRWGQVRLGGIGFDTIAVTVLAAVGIGLFLLDFFPSLRVWLLDRTVTTVGEPDKVATLTREIDELALCVPVRPPSLRLVDCIAPVMLCSGLLRLRLVVSTGAVRALDGRQLRAGLAHELAHAFHGDPRSSWGLMAVRTLFFFSPATQFVARAVVAELERRADDLSVSITGDRLAMAGALVRLFTTDYRVSEGVDHRRRAPLRQAASWLHLGRAAAVERRCRRLLVAPPSSLTLRPAYTAVVGISLVFLLFFVV